MTRIGGLFCVLSMVSGISDILSGGDHQQSLVFAVLAAGCLIAGAIEEVK